VGERLHRMRHGRCSAGTELKRNDGGRAATPTAAAAPPLPSVPAANRRPHGDADAPTNAPLDRLADRSNGGPVPPVPARRAADQPARSGRP
jgi:hypothetical protein